MWKVAVLALILVHVTAGCGHSHHRKAERKPDPPPPSVSLHIPEATPNPQPETEPEIPEPPYEEARASITILWLYDRADGLYSYADPGEQLQTINLTLPEAKALGVPPAVWVFALENPGQTVVCLVKRFRS